MVMRVCKYVIKFDMIGVVKDVLLIILKLLLLLFRREMVIFMFVVYILYVWEKIFLWLWILVVLIKIMFGICVFL